MGPKRLWTGDWSAQSAAARARMAERRGLVAPEPEPLPEPEPAVEDVPEPVPSRSLGELLRGALASFVASARALAAELRRPGGARVRLAFIALIAAAAGAGTVIGIQASSTSTATPAAAKKAGAWLGVELGSALGQAGAMVEFVDPGSPADEAGIQLGDVITAIDGHAINGPAAAISTLAALRPGASALLALDRFGQPVTLRVTLGSRSTATP